MDMRASFSRVALIKEFFAPEKTLLQFLPDLKGIIGENNMDELVEMIVEEWGMAEISMENRFGEIEKVYLGTPK